jgi:2-polyprenyl-6-methoxyphenol hydroxylase-like FAD-dependent oxidoreductase
MGAQGMNTGIQDAMNLGWKLAATVHGWASANLLDSYEDERHPVGERVLKMTDAFNELIIGGWRITKPLQRALMAVLLRLRPTQRVMARRVSGITIRYPRPPGAHPLTGQRATDIPLGDSRLYRALRDAKFVLVDGTAGGAATAATMEWSNRLNAVQPSLRAKPVVELVRPDGYVAWATDIWTDSTAGHLAGAMSRWCGSAHYRQPKAASSWPANS